MLKIIVEFHPHGSEYRKEQIAAIEIINTKDCKHRPDFGNYRAIIDGKEEVIIKNHDRDKDVWELVKKILNRRKKK